MHTHICYHIKYVASSIQDTHRAHNSAIINDCSIRMALVGEYDTDKTGPISARSTTSCRILMGGGTMVEWAVMPTKDPY
jgi:hypothetical protein